MYHYFLYIFQLSSNPKPLLSWIFIHTNWFFFSLHILLNFGPFFLNDTRATRKQVCIMEGQDLSPPRMDTSRPSLGFPLGTALLLIIIFSLSGIFSCCYHWDKLRSFRQSHPAPSHAQSQPSTVTNHPHLSTYTNTTTTNIFITITISSLFVCAGAEAKQGWELTGADAWGWSA